MKNLIKKSMLIVVLFTTIIMNAANDDRGFNLKVIDSKKVSLTLQNYDGSSKVRVIDSSGEVLYKESFNGTYFYKMYDLMTLPNGDYYFEVEGQTKIKLLPFKVNDQEVVFNNEVETVYFKPIVRQDGDFVHISKMALANESMKIYLYDNKYDKLYNEELSGELHFGKTLDVSKLEKGNYRLVLISDDRIFTHVINK
jgi:hypothetical protein